MTQRRLLAASRLGVVALACAPAAAAQDAKLQGTAAPLPRPVVPVEQNVPYAPIARDHAPARGEFQEADDAAPPPHERGAASSAAPHFVKLLPTRYDKDEIVLAVDQELRLAVVVEHPEGRPLELQALGLPQRASFDAELRAVTWRPTEAEIGSYQVRFVATDGEHEASRTLLVSVTENRPPVIGSLWFEIPASQPATWFIEATDPEMSPLTFKAEGLPQGAAFDEHSGQLSFTPDAAQVGEYPIVVQVSDGQKATTQRGTIVVRPPERTPPRDENWTSFLLPGGGYSVYVPRDSADTIFHGLNLELVIAAWIHRNDYRGPSHGRVYINAELLNATGLHIPLMFTYAAGLSLSFERNPQRTYLIPHYGLEVGGIVHEQLGAFFQTTPYLGVHLYANPNVILGARVGYRLVPSRIDDLAGLHTGLLADFSIW